MKRLREERERSVSGEAKPDEVSVNDRLSSPSEDPGRSCRESNSTDLKPPKHPGHQGGGGGAKEEEVAKQEASVESAAASKESSDVRSSASLCRRRGSGSGKADEEEEEEEEAASAARPPPARSPPLASLVDAVSAKLGSVLQRLREHGSEVGAPVITILLVFSPFDVTGLKIRISKGTVKGYALKPGNMNFSKKLVTCQGPGPTPTLD